MFKTINGGKMPQRGSKYSACVDLFANEDVTIGAGETKVVGLGVCIDPKEFIRIALFYQGKYKTNASIPDEVVNNMITDDFKKSHYLLLEPRSSLRAKGLIIGSGIVDMDYTQQIKMIIHNPLKPYTIVEKRKTRTYVKSTDKFQIKKGDKIAQITLLQHKSYLFGIDTKEERTGGIGSTGV